MGAGEPAGKPDEMLAGSLVMDQPHIQGEKYQSAVIHEYDYVKIIYVHCRLRNEYESRNKLQLNSSENKVCKDGFHFQSGNTLSPLYATETGKSLFLTVPYLMLQRMKTSFVMQRKESSQRKDRSH